MHTKSRTPKVMRHTIDVVSHGFFFFLLATLASPHLNPTMETALSNAPTVLLFAVLLLASEIFQFYLFGFRQHLVATLRGAGAGSISGVLLYIMTYMLNLSPTIAMIAVILFNFIAYTKMRSNDNNNTPLLDKGSSAPASELREN